MIIALIKHALVDAAGPWIEKFPAWVLYVILLITGAVAWLLPDVIPYVEEGLVAMIYVKIGHELVRRKKMKELADAARKAKAIADKGE